MRLSVLRGDEDPIVVLCAGELRTAPAGSADPFQKLLGAGTFSKRVMVNMQDVTFLSSAGIGGLMASHYRFRKGGGRLVFYAIPPIVAQVVQFLRLDQVLLIAPDEAAARGLACPEKGPPQAARTPEGAPAST